MALAKSLGQKNIGYKRNILGHTSFLKLSLLVLLDELPCAYHRFLEIPFKSVLDRGYLDLFARVRFGHHLDQGLELTLVGGVVLWV